MKIDVKVDHSKKRAVEYPDIGDQLDALWKALEILKTQGTNIGVDADTILTSITNIKAKYPKNIL